jgi:2-oxoisovalerate dehydrogenase E1 component beta subunit
MATMIQAIRMALHVGESRHGVTDIFGEDVGPPLGGVFTGTQGLETAWNTPLDERGIVGTAIGLAMAGRKPVAEIQFCDYAFNTIDLLKIAGNTYWSTGGDWNVPMVLMTPVGAGIRGSIYHSHSFDAQATRIPGWKIVMPSTARDAYGLLLSAIVDPNPVMFLMPKALLRMKGAPGEIPGEPDDERALNQMIDAPLGDRTAWKPSWPALEDLFIPIGKARIAREGTDLSIITYAATVYKALEAAEQLEREDGLSVEVLDLRSLAPLDDDAIDTTVKKTNRVLIVHEDTRTGGLAGELTARINERCFEWLDAPVLRVTAHDVPLPYAPSLEDFVLPQTADIVLAARRLAAY